jgi:hypothetical protein
MERLHFGLRIMRVWLPNPLAVHPPGRRKRGNKAAPGDFSRIKLSLPDGVESILEMFDYRAFVAFWPGDCHDIEACPAFEQAVPLHECDRQSSQSSLLARIDGIGGMADFLGGPRFDFDKDDGSAIESHQIELAGRKAASAGKNLVPQPSQEPCRLVLAAPAE